MFSAANAKGNQESKLTPAVSQNVLLKGNKYFLKYQAFASHDKEGTDIDTVSNEGDYIVFSDNGIAYMYFKGSYDSLSYTLIDKNAVSFGDTPFVVKNLGNGYISLYQNEEEANGDYNRVTYLLKEDNEKKLSLK